MSSSLVQQIDSQIAVLEAQLANLKKAKDALGASKPPSPAHSTPSENTFFDFGDGKGPVPAKRHINPDGTIGGWVANTATVAATAYIGAQARVFGFAQVLDKARVGGHAQVFDNARVFGNAEVYGNARVFGRARVFDNAKVFGTTWVSGNAQVFDGQHINAWRYK